MIASIVTRWTCKKVSDVDGPSIFDNLTGVFIFSQTDSTTLRFVSKQLTSLNLLLSSIKGVELYGCLLESS